MQCPFKPQVSMKLYACWDPLRLHVHVKFHSTLNRRLQQVYNVIVSLHVTYTC